MNTKKSALRKSKYTYICYTGRELKITDCRFGSQKGIYIVRFNHKHKQVGKEGQIDALREQRSTVGAEDEHRGAKREHRRSKNTKGALTREQNDRRLYSEWVLETGHPLVLQLATPRLKWIITERFPRNLEISKQIISNSIVCCFHNDQSEDGRNMGRTNRRS